MVDTNTNEQSSIGGFGYKVIGRKSWVAYIGALLRYMIICGVIFFVDNYVETPPELNWINDYILYVYAFFGVLFIYRIAVLHSYKVSVTNEGVYINWGILPWAKGGNGLRWNDADMAFYYPSFISWITNSYKITVKHKYTNTSDFIVPSIWRGRKVCTQISEIQTNRLGV